MMTSNGNAWASPSSTSSQADSNPALSAVVGGNIVSFDSGRCLDVRGGPGNSYNGTPVQVWDCGGPSYPNQQWNLYPVFYSEYWEATAYHIRSQDSGRCLDVSGGVGSIANGTPVQVWDCLGQSANQLWIRRTYDSGRSLQIVDYDSTRNDPKCLDVRGGRGQGSAGTPVQIWSCLGLSQTNQLWAHVTQ